MILATSMSCCGTGMMGLETLPASCDIPPGRTDRIISGITGRPLAYFTPDPLPELLSRLPQSEHGAISTGDADAAFALVQAAAQRNAGDTDVSQAVRYCEVLTGYRHLNTVADMLGTGGDISPRAACLREEIVFSGGRTASLAEQIFAPAPVLRHLIESLAEGMQALPGSDTNANAILLAATVGFYAVHTHPFLDANGRWSRLQSAYAAKTVGNPLDGMISATMQSSAKNRLSNDIWPVTRQAGFRGYFRFAMEFGCKFSAMISPALVATTKINGVLRNSITSRRSCNTAITQLHSTGSLELSDLRSIAGISMKSALGISQKIREAAGDFTETTSSSIRIHTLHTLIKEAANHCATKQYSDQSE